MTWWIFTWSLWKSSLDGLASSHVQHLTLLDAPKILLYSTEYNRPTTDIFSWLIWQWQDAKSNFVLAIGSLLAWNGSGKSELWSFFSAYIRGKTVKIETQLSENGRNFRRTKKSRWKFFRPKIAHAHCWYCLPLINTWSNVLSFRTILREMKLLLQLLSSNTKTCPKRR